MGIGHSSNTFNFTADTNSIDLISRGLNSLTIAPHLEEKIKYLNLAGNEIQTIPEGMKEIILLNFTKNKMGPQIPSQIAKQIITYTKLKTFYLSNNQLKELNKILQNPSVESMFLSQNRFEEFPKNFFDKFPLIRTLYFDCNFIESFSNLQSDTLTSLSLSLNYIKTLDCPNLTFSGLHTLDLSKNEIQKIPKDFSKSFPKLSSLNLNFNLISEVEEDDAFPKTLKELKLSYNLIEKVPNSVTSLPVLTYLTIDNNQLKHLPKLPESIINLDASFNSIETIEEQNLPNLRDFWLNDNKLTKFPTEVKAEKSDSFILHHNMIVDFDITSLSRSISTIDISFNKIEKIPKELFENFTNLQNFTAYSNMISEIPAEIAKSEQLYFLNISDNPLKKLPKLPRSITQLEASNCQLTSFEDNFADARPVIVTTSEGEITEEESICLRNVDLSRNMLETFPDFEDIQYLNLSQNQLKKLPKVTNAIKVLDVSMNKIEEMPESISANSLIELNLSFNSLKKLPLFENLPFVQSIIISGNPVEAQIDVTSFTYLQRVDITQTKSVTFVNNSDTKHEVITSVNDASKYEQMKHDPIYINQIEGKSGYSEFIGLRESMEDAIIVRDDLNLYAVCDGHGGSKTANYAAIHLNTLFDFSLKNGSYSFEKAKYFISEVFNQMNEQLQKQGFNDGSTLCLCFLCQNDKGLRKVVTAHLGDARAMIVTKDGKAKKLTTDHKPSMRTEFDEIHKRYGRLSTDNRVDGVLAVARSIGDYTVFGLGRDLELNEFGLDENDRYLVVCCDGVFDVLSNEDVAKIAYNTSSPNEAAFIIRNAAFGFGSSDNISVIVVDLTAK
ncbi:hypothetical protein M9Y10_026273 [Tritrichomonas musculus]|uniref:PPM-type phosphatase domain-containing protein n=1 Tax=Tritrichomonas musculus TaxID=1915356 RepID=A0ABR2H7B7_9EUKA